MYKDNMTKKCLPYHTFICLFILFSISHASAASSPWQMEAKHIAEEYRVHVVFDAIKFPYYWGAWTPEWVTVPEGKRLEALKKLKIDLSHYNSRFLRKHLDKIYLLSVSFKKVVASR